MKRTTVFLPDDLHEQLRREAFRAKISMAELIRSRLRGRNHPRLKQFGADPLREVEGIIHDGALGSNLDDDLYR
ncbi:MAG TPA: CopG family transcriptional regulator [Bryobacteraceae bacterium]|nr:CopG family transcriptional regulator [Bryobacteraceae bacterium]